MFKDEKKTSKEFCQKLYEKGRVPYSKVTVGMYWYSYLPVLVNRLRIWSNFELNPNPLFDDEAFWKRKGTVSFVINKEKLAKISQLHLVLETAIEKIICKKGGTLSVVKTIYF